MKAVSAPVRYSIPGCRHCTFSMYRSPVTMTAACIWLSTKKNKYRPKYSSAGFWSIRPSVRACILMRDDNITPPTQMASTV